MSVSDLQQFLQFLEVENEASEKLKFHPSTTWKPVQSRRRYEKRRVTAEIRRREHQELEKKKRRIEFRDMESEAISSLEGDLDEDFPFVDFEGRHRETLEIEDEYDRLLHCISTGDLSPMTVDRAREMAEKYLFLDYFKLESAIRDGERVNLDEAYADFLDDWEPDFDGRYIF